MAPVDAKQLKEDVYIIKAKQNLIKVDLQVLKQIPKLAKAHEEGALRPGRPYDLATICRPRAIRDVLRLFERHSAGLDALQDFRSAQIDVESHVRQRLHQLHAAADLQLDSISALIVSHLEQRWVGDSSIKQALAHLDNAEDATAISALLEDFGLPHSLPTGYGIFADFWDTFGSFALPQIPFQPQQTFPSNFPTSLKRRTSTHAYQDNLSTPTPKKLRLGPRTSNEPDVNNMPALISGTSAQERAPATIAKSAAKVHNGSHQEPRHMQDNSQNECDPDFDEAVLEIDEDEFEHEQNDFDVHGQDSFEIDEAEITSDDIDELIMSDPAMYDCIASPQTPRKQKQVDYIVSAAPSEIESATAPATPSPLKRQLPAPITRKVEKEVVGQRQLVAQNSQVRMLSLSPAKRIRTPPIPSVKEKIAQEDSPTSLNITDPDHVYFKATSFLCISLNMDSASCYLLLTSESLDIHYENDHLSRDALFKVPFSKIRSCKIGDNDKDEEEMLSVQINLSIGILPGNTFYVTFNMFETATDLVKKVQKLHPSLKLVIVTSAWMAKAVGEARKWLSTPPSSSGRVSEGKVIEIVDVSDDDGPPSMHKILRPQGKVRAGPSKHSFSR